MKASSRRGSALLIVLSFVVILSVVLLAYLARTRQAMRSSDSSATLLKTDWLAETAESAIIDDLRMEMLAGADNITLPATNEPMLVKQSWAMKPARVVASTIPLNDVKYANLVKQSLSGRPFYATNATTPVNYTAKTGVLAIGASRASAINTSAPSKNGRLISAARWNKPALLRAPGLSGDQLPDWIFITRSGVATTGGTSNRDRRDPGNANFVIGRFAYNIYDISGLLDVNVAGFDSSDATIHDEAASKGSVVWADLNAVPGMTNPNALVSWRNAVSKGNYADMVKEWGEPKGFKEPFRSGSNSDNRLFSRQELLNFQKTHGQTMLSSDALPFLTTFSADYDQPSIAPHPDRPKVQRNSAAGGNDAFGRDDAINVNFLAMRDSKGDPVVKRRFPLDSLALLRPSPSGEAVTKISVHFGLVWQDDGDPSADQEYAWHYRDPRIKNLSELADATPNFFEVLKAAIIAGSLGGQFHNTAPQQPERTTSPASPRVLGGRDGSVDFQVVQIAANIIDQYDSDSFPTRIVFNGRTFYGTEDLPYLYVFRRAVYRVAQVTAGEFTGTPPTKSGSPPTPLPLPFRSVMFIQPTLWNPHAPNLDSPPPPTEVPQSLQVTAESDSVPQVLSLAPWWPPGGATNVYPSSNLEDSPRSTILSEQTDYITFSLGSTAFREPYTLTSPNYPAVGITAASVIKTVLPNQELNEAGDGSTVPTTSVTGFWLGPIWTGPYADDGTASHFFQNDVIASDGINFKLKYLTPDGRYVTYQSVEQVRWAGKPGEGQTAGFHDIDSTRNNAANGRPAMRYLTMMDPRSDRFGMHDGNNYVPRSSNGNGLVYSDIQRRWLQGWTSWYNPAALAYGHFGSGRSAGNVNWTYPADGTIAFWALISRNKAGDAIFYSDPDGVQRVAMGGYNDGGSSTVGLPTVTGNNNSRPMILNRPFRSVAELGYAFRGTPWKQLDFWTPKSGDAALLDLFCLAEPAEETAEPVVSGKINLNSAGSEVLQALLRGVDKAGGTTSALADIEAKNIADALVLWTSGTRAGEGPLKNRSELVSKYDGALSGSTTEKFSGFTDLIANQLTGDDRVIQKRRQNIMRALVDSGTTRTWTLLIDLIVQDGRYPENENDLAKFLVKGERRYWIQLSMDRYTGKVISKFIETVNE